MRVRLKPLFNYNQLEIGKQDNDYYVEDLDYWLLRNGDLVKIKDLRKTHIINILDMMKSKVGRLLYGKA